MIARDVNINDLFTVLDRFEDAIRVYIYRRIGPEIKEFRVLPVQRVRTTHTRSDGKVVLDSQPKQALTYIDALTPVEM